MAARLGLVLTLWFITLLVAGVAVVALLQAFPPASAGGGFNWLEARRLALHPVVIILALVLFFYSAVEISTAGWTRTFLRARPLRLAIDFEGHPHHLLGCHDGGASGGEPGGQIRARDPSAYGAALGAVCGLLVVATAHSVGAATAGIVICGLAYAPVFPTTAGTASTYFPKLFATAFGILMAVGLSAGVILPPAIGYVAKTATVRAGISLVLAFAVMLAVVQGIFLVYERRRLRA